MERRADGAVHKGPNVVRARTACKQSIAANLRMGCPGRSTILQVAIARSGAVAKNSSVARQFDDGRRPSKTQIRQIRDCGTRQEKYSALPEQQQVCGPDRTSF